MLSVLTLGLIFIEEIEPCQFEIENVSVASCKIVTFLKFEVLKFEPRVILICRSCEV